MSKIHHSALTIIDSAEREIAGHERAEALREFRREGTIRDLFFARTGAAHEDADDASTWGPESPKAVDWDGFEA